MHYDQVTCEPAIEIRPRHEGDLPDLESVLAAQQPNSHYPFRWPLPFPARQFIVRSGELLALVATAGDVVVGHVSVTRVNSDDLGTTWSAATATPIEDLACLSVLFVDQSMRGQRIGGTLMDAAEEWIFRCGYTAVLDVVQRHSNALAVYRHRGWEEVGQARPRWLPDTEPPVILMAKGHTGQLGAE